MQHNHFHINVLFSLIQVDLTEEATTKIAQAQGLPDLSSALTLLFALEKKCRVGNDGSSLVRVCEACLQLCRDHSDEEALLNALKKLSTKRSQKSAVISSLVHKASRWIVQEDGLTPISVSNDKERETREKLIVALRDITDGKMFLEVERARLSRALSIIKREENNNKIQKKVINEENVQEEKIKYHTLMSEHYMHQKDAFQLAKNYDLIYSTTLIIISCVLFLQWLNSIVDSEVGRKKTEVY